MEKQKMIEKLKVAFPHVDAINCLTCKHSHSDSEHNLTCTLYDEMVAENQICMDFTR